MRKIIFLISVLAVAVMIPILTANAINEVDIEIQVKEKIDEMIKTLQEKLDKPGMAADSEITKKIAGLEDFKDVIVLSEQLQQATDDKPELERQLEEKLEELKEHAGDRYVNVVITPTDDGSDEEVSTQSFWLPSAYATNGLSGFEFTKRHGS